MNRLEILLKQWKEGKVLNQDLALCLSYINGIQIEKAKNESRLSHTEGNDPISGSDNLPEPKRSKAKRL